MEIVQVNAPLPAELDRVVAWCARPVPAEPVSGSTVECRRPGSTVSRHGQFRLGPAPAALIGWLRRIPVIVNYRGGEGAAFFDRQFRWLSPTLARAGAVVVPSAFLEAVFNKRQVAAEIVPNVIDLSHGFPGQREPGKFHLIDTRNLEDIYDIPNALRAFAVVQRHSPSARLTVAGSGPKLADLQRLCDSMSIASAVCFTGRLDNERVAELYRLADLMLNPSLADNMPISLLEAVASGVPIISMGVGGVPHLVEDGRDALLVPPGDFAAMAGAAIRVLQDRELALRLTRSGIEADQRFTWTEVKPQVFSVYARAHGVASLSPHAS